MNILFLGPQGSGKGTQARLLVGKFDFFYFEAGEFLRDLASKNDEVKKMIDAGQMVPDGEMSSYVEAFFDEKQIYDDILFDGFPRTLPQYEFFKNWLKEKKVKLDLAFILNISEETTVKRLSARRLDSETGAIYNLITDPPPVDIDKEKLIQREDDRPDAIRKRLAIYQEITVPLISRLKKDVEVVEVDAERPIAEIQKDIVNKVESVQNG